MKQNILALLLLFPFLGALPACAGPTTYSAEAIEARVVDADTKQPLEGVVVVAHWVLEGGIHVDRVGDLMILESVTDKEGKFIFSAWGPIRHWKSSRLTYMDPEILIFRSGYEYLRLTNEPTPEALGGKAFPVRTSRWNGKTIELKRFRGKGEKYAEHIYWLSVALDRIHDFARGAKTCTWKNTPQILVALHKISVDFEKKNVRLHGGRIHRIEDIPMYPGCGSPKEYFKAFLP